MKLVESIIDDVHTQLKGFYNYPVFRDSDTKESFISDLKNEYLKVVNKYFEFIRLFDQDFGVITPSINEYIGLRISELYPNVNSNVKRMALSELEKYFPKEIPKLIEEYSKKVKNQSPQLKYKPSMSIYEYLITHWVNNNTIKSHQSEKIESLKKHIVKYSGSDSNFYKTESHTNFDALQWFESGINSYETMVEDHYKSLETVRRALKLESLNDVFMAVTSISNTDYIYLYIFNPNTMLHLYIYKDTIESIVEYNIRADISKVEIGSEKYLKIYMKTTEREVIKISFNDISQAVKLRKFLTDRRSVNHRNNNHSKTRHANRNDNKS